MTLHEERLTGIGGSDIASLFNIGWGCRRRLFYEKTATPPDFAKQETDAMKLGKVLEDFFAEKYKSKSDRQIRNCSLSRHSFFDALLVHVDRLVVRQDIGPKHLGVLEIKSVGRNVFYKYKREGLPEDYILQLQHGMLITSTSWGSFAVGCRDNGALLWWDVERNEDICQRILQEGPNFWTDVQMARSQPHLQLAPDRLEPDDRRCQDCSYRVTCQGDALIELEPSTEYEEDESLRPLVMEFLERQSLVKEAKDLFEESQEELRDKLGDRGLVSVGGAKIQYQPYERKAYTVKATRIRALRVYPPKERI